MNITDISIKTESWPKNLATICTIKSLEAIPDADKIVLASLNENSWKCVVKKDEFVCGQKVIYICIDSIVDKENPFFSFMESRKFRVWGCKFKKTFSQGLIVPVSVLEFYGFNPLNFNIGDDVGQQIKVAKFEKVIEEKSNPEAKGGFPSYLISKSDELNLLSYPKALTELSASNTIVCTTKSDGQSSTFIYKDGEAMACSRNLVMKDNCGYPWRFANKYNLKEKLEARKQNLALQFECVGVGQQGNNLKLPDIQIRLFRAKDLDNNRILNFIELQNLAKELDIPTVEPVFIEKFDASKHTIEYFQEIANNLKYPSGSIAEGICLSVLEPLFSYVLGKEWSVKVINQNYKQ